MPPFSRSLPRESATAAYSSEGVNEGRIFATNESPLGRYVVNDWPGPALSSNYAVKSSIFAYQVFTFVRFVARFRICTVGGGYDVLIVFNGGLIDVFPFVLLDGRRPIVNPICKARNATALLQASPAATAARDNFQCDRLSRYCDHLNRQRQPGSTMEPVERANLPRLRAPLGRGTQRAAAATPQRAATAANAQTKVTCLPALNRSDSTWPRVLYLRKVPFPSDFPKLL